MTNLRDRTKTPRKMPQPHQRGYVLNALAFSTLLSSQETDAHLQQPPGRLQGNYSNLPDAFPPVKPDPQEFLENKWAIRPTSETLSDSE